MPRRDFFCAESLIPFLTRMLAPLASVFRAVRLRVYGRQRLTKIQHPAQASIDELQSSP